MQDEFLHRLRKEPRPEFVARLQAQLQRQSASSSVLQPKAPSRVRTLLTLLLLGGAAFAITSLAMRGLPRPVLELYQRAAAWIGAEHSTAPAQRAGNQGFGGWLPWGARGSSSPHGGALQSTPTPSATLAATARAAPTSSAGSPSGSPSVGAAGLRIPQIRVVSSWAAYPYAAAIADRLNGATGTAEAPIAPHIEVSVRDADLVPGLMCSGGAKAPDIAYAFEPAGTTSDRPCPRDAPGSPGPVTAILIGYEAVALARSPLYGDLDLTRRQIFLALAKQVPDPAQPGTVHENTNTTWRQIDAILGPEPIEVMGPPLASAAGRSMIELVMEGGCDTFPWIAALESTDPARHARICRTIRTDGIYIAVSNLNAARLLAEPNAVGIVGLHGPSSIYNFVQFELSGMAVSTLDGVEPTPQGIEVGAYAGSRGFYLYINRTRVAPDVVRRLMGGGGWPAHSDWAVLPLTPAEYQAAYSEALEP